MCVHRRRTQAGRGPTASPVSEMKSEVGGDLQGAVERHLQVLEAGGESSADFPAPQFVQESALEALHGPVGPDVRGWVRS